MFLKYYRQANFSETGDRFKESILFLVNLKIFFVSGQPVPKFFHIQVADSVLQNVHSSLTLCFSKETTVERLS